MQKRQIKGVIFDLDDTLFDCTTQLKGPARLRAAKYLAIKISSRSPDELCELQATLSSKLGSSGAIWEIGHRYNLPTPVIEKALQNYNRDTVESIILFSNTLETLSKLRQRNYQLSLVTTGNPNRQRRKVHLLNLNHYFDEEKGNFIIHDYRDDPHKDTYLHRAAITLNLPTSKILSVGDKLDSEIAASNRLGMATARLRHGSQRNRSPQSPEEVPNYEIDLISDLLDILP